MTLGLSFFYFSDRGREPGNEFEETNLAGRTWRGRTGGTGLGRQNWRNGFREAELAGRV